MGVGAAILFADWSTKKGTIMGYAAIGIEVLILLVPFLFYYILKKNRDKLALPSMKAKIGTLYMGTNTTSFWSLMYSFIFLWRRNVFIGITYLLFDYPSLQVHLFLYSNVIYIIYINSATPHSESFSLATEVINETMFLLVCYHFVLFTNVVSDPIIRNQVGWSLITFIGAMFAFNVGVIVFVTYKGLSRKFYLKKLQKIHL